MAPLPSQSIRTLLASLLSRNASPSPTISDLSPKSALLAARAQNLVARAAAVDPTVGVTPPSDIPNKAVFVLFGLIGAGFVISGIWFFFWAKNGGFYFKENDWDDYKSTVLRRKGPNGTTLSGATESTDLGGGSVVHGGSRWGKARKGKKEKRYRDKEFDFEDETAYTGSTLGTSELSHYQQEVKKEKKSKDKKNKKKRQQEMSEVGTEIGTVDEEMDVGVHEELRAYRHEKVAEVGGLNKEADGSAFDGSTHDGSTAASELLSHREKTPTSTPTKVRKERKDNYTGGTGGIRKVMPSTRQPAPSESGTSGFWSRSSASGSEPVRKSKTLLDTSNEAYVKAEAQRLQDKGRAAQRRDFSFRVGDDNSTVVSSSTASDERAAKREERQRRRASKSPVKKTMPGSYVEGSYIEDGSVLGSELSGDIGTKSYHHPIPGLSSTVGSEYADERRKKRNGGGGYRRGATDDLDEF